MLTVPQDNDTLLHALCAKARGNMQRLRSSETPESTTVKTSKLEEFGLESSRGFPDQ
jgi:hypothetical protein